MKRFEANKVNRPAREKASLLSNEHNNPIPLETDVRDTLPEPSVAADSNRPTLEESVQRLSSTPTSLARQQIFRSLATHYGNGYASQLSTVMRATGPTTEAAPPDELDSLLGLTTHAAHYNDQQLKDARQMAEAETDPAKQGKLFKLLQLKTTYYSQNKNESKAFDNRNHKTWNLGEGMCNVSSLAMALEGVGVTFTQAKAAFPDTFEKYKAVILAEQSLSLEDRQTWAAATTEATRFPDLLEQLRLVNHFSGLTQRDTWKSLAALFGVSLSYIAPDEGQHPKQWWLDHVQTAFESGHSVVVGVEEHIIRLQEVNDGGLVLDDPNAQTNLGKGMTRRNGKHLDFSWDYSKSGNDTFVPWEVAEKYNFRWVYQLKGAGAVAGRAAARPQPSGPAQAQGANPAHSASTPTATDHTLFSPQEKQKALVAMKRALVDGMGKNKVIDQGYFAVRGEGKIDPADKQAIAEWLYIQDHLLHSAVNSLPVYLLTGD